MVKTKRAGPRTAVRTLQYRLHGSAYPGSRGSYCFLPNHPSPIWMEWLEPGARQRVHVVWTSNGLLRWE